MDLLSNVYDLEIKVLTIMLLLVVCNFLYTFRKDKTSRLYIYFCPYFKIKNRTKQISFLYWGVVCVSEGLVFFMIEKRIVFMLFFLIVIFLIAQYCMYGIILLGRKVVEILVCLDNVALVAWIILPAAVALSSSLQGSFIWKDLLLVVTFILSVVNTVLMLCHLLELVTDKNYRIRVAREYFSRNSNNGNSIIKMKLEIIMVEYIVLIIQLSMIVYLLVVLSSNGDWILNNIPLRKYKDCLYYTITTFTSIGYGIIIPSTCLAKMADLFISCIGIVFIGCFIGLILEKDDIIEDEISQTEDAIHASKCEVKKI